MASLDLRFVRSPPQYHPPTSGAINLSVTRILLHAYGLGICPQRIVAEYLNVSKESLSRFGGKVGFHWPFNRLKGANAHKALAGTEDVWIEVGIAHLLNTSIYAPINEAEYDPHDEATVTLFRTVLPMSKKRGAPLEITITTRVRLIRAGSTPCIPEKCTLAGRMIAPPKPSLAHVGMFHDAATLSKMMNYGARQQQSSNHRVDNGSAVTRPHPSAVAPPPTTAHRQLPPPHYLPPHHVQQPTATSTHRYMAHHAPDTVGSYHGGAAGGGGAGGGTRYDASHPSPTPQLHAQSIPTTTDRMVPMMTAADSTATTNRATPPMVANYNQSLSPSPTVITAKSEPTSSPVPMDVGESSYSPTSSDQRALFVACNALGALGEMAKNLPDPPSPAGGRLAPPKFSSMQQFRPISNTTRLPQRMMGGTERAYHHHQPPRQSNRAPLHPHAPKDQSPHHPPRENDPEPTRRKSSPSSS